MIIWSVDECDQRKDKNTIMTTKITLADNMILSAMSYQCTKSVKQRLSKMTLLVKPSRRFQERLQICLAERTLQIICSFLMYLSEEIVLDDDSFEWLKLEDM